MEQEGYLSDTLQQERQLKRPTMDIMMINQI